MRHGATVLPYSPQEIYIDPSNACDLRCTFCPQSNWGQRQRGQMLYDLFERLLIEVVQLNPSRLNLFCYGESLLHKRLPEMIRAAVDRGVWVRLHTNAKTLDETKAKALLEAGLSELHFSFDTADKVLYNQLRVRSDFDLVYGNIRRFLHLKQSAGYSHPLVFAQEMFPYNSRKKPKTSKSYRELFDGFDIHFSPRYMHNFAGSSAESNFPGMEPEGESQCPELYRRIVINFDGQVHACCLDAEGHNIVGDVAKGETIASVWNNLAMQRLRQLTNERVLDGLRPCDTCDIIRRKKRSLPPLHKRWFEDFLWHAFLHLRGA